LQLVVKEPKVEPNTDDAIRKLFNLKMKLETWSKLTESFTNSATPEVF
jgi:hypothetical protein